jgi:hypothetical protein
LPPSEHADADADTNILARARAQDDDDDPAGFLRACGLVGTPAGHGSQTVDDDLSTSR